MLSDKHLHCPILVAAPVFVILSNSQCAQQSFQAYMTIQTILHGVDKCLDNSLDN